MSTFPTPITKNYYNENFQRVNHKLQRELFHAFHSQSGEGIQIESLTRYPDGSFTTNDMGMWQVDDNFYGSELDKARNVLRYCEFAEILKVKQFQDYKSEVLGLCNYGRNETHPMLPQKPDIYKEKLDQLRTAAREAQKAKKQAQDNVNSLDPAWISPAELERRAAETARFRQVLTDFKKEIELIEI